MAWQAITKVASHPECAVNTTAPRLPTANAVAESVGDSKTAGGEDIRNLGRDPWRKTSAKRRIRKGCRGIDGRKVRGLRCSLSPANPSSEPQPMQQEERKRSRALPQQSRPSFQPFQPANRTGVFGPPGHQGSGGQHGSP
jgi:hypothetical protein